MVINEGMFTSNSSDWLTPEWLLEYLYRAFIFDLDPCSNRGPEQNVKAVIHYFEGGLEKDWFGTVFMNPPYGRVISAWFAKACDSVVYESAETVVCLIPARTDTQWFQASIREASCVVFIKGRLKFSNAENSAPFPSALVVFGKISKEQAEHLGKLGWRAK